MVLFTSEMFKHSPSITELQTQTDRGVAIVGGSFVETFLEKLLKSFLRSDDETALREMFRTSGPLGTFSAKIRLGFLLRFYGAKAHRELHFIKDIRNRFAHELGHISFSSRPIDQWCRELKLVDGYFNHISEKPRLAGVPGMRFFEDKAEADTHLSKERNRFVETCRMFMETFSFGHTLTFPPIHDDDRPGWPIISWQLPTHL
jgi:DNA-binding MltR family transcriptional regulator